MKSIEEHGRALRSAIENARGYSFPLVNPDGSEGPRVFINSGAGYDGADSPESLIVSVSGMACVVLGQGHAKVAVWSFVRQSLSRSAADYIIAIIIQAASEQARKGLRSQ